MASVYFNHPVLKDIITECEDKFQGYTAFNLYLRLCEQFQLEVVKWRHDPFLKMIILDSKHNGKSKVFLPLHFTHRPCAKWIRETTAYVKGLHPEASFHLAFTSSSQTFVIYQTDCGLEMLKNQDSEALRKAKIRR